MRCGDSAWKWPWSRTAFNDVTIMMVRILAMLFLFVTGGFSWAQTSPDTYWVQFTDKVNTPYSLDQPLEFLSERAIQRRQTQGIPLDDLDLPMDPQYIGAVLALGEVYLVNKSKWFNAITIRTSDEAVLEIVQSLPFVADVRSVRTTTVPGKGSLKFGSPVPGVAKGGDQYGLSFTQIAMMNGHQLHELGARGEGILIGLLDSGFEGVDVLAAFDALRDREGIVMTRDVLVDDGDVYSDHWHGRSVLSCMAGVLEGELVGTAPMADYALFRTENADWELIIEEDHWVSGAELCDSLGVDVLNASLGYTLFDWPEQDHTYADMDGQTTRVSIACGIAATRGMIPVISAGNSGSSEFHFLSAPSDALNILSVGAVDADEIPADFSSWGPSADGRVKPDVAAMGLGTFALGVDGTEVVPINGTSFAAPLVAGLVSCLWQLHPDRTANDVMDAVRRSASHYSMPQDQIGHGIPDFMQAHALLQLSAGTADVNDQELQVFPVPFTDRLLFRLPHGPGGTVQVNLMDLAGRKVWSRSIPDRIEGDLVIADPSLGSLASGPYVIRITRGTWSGTLAVAKAQ